MSELVSFVPEGIDSLTLSMENFILSLRRFTYSFTMSSLLTAVKFLCL